MFNFKKIVIFKINKLYMDYAILEKQYKYTYHK